MRAAAHTPPARAIYKAVLRAAARAAPYISSSAQYFPDDARVQWPRTAAAFLRAVRTQARSRAIALQHGASDATCDYSELTSDAIEFIQHANKLATMRSSESYEQRPDIIKYHVGDCFRHRDGWRGVVIGYDDSCAAGPRWTAASNVASLPHGVHQPFYHVLADVRDVEGGRRTPYYVPQDDIVELLSATVGEVTAAGGSNTSTFDPAAAAARALVLHPDTPSFFASYAPAARRFVPGVRLEQLYPDDALVSAAIVAACRRAATTTMRHTEAVTGIEKALVTERDQPVPRLITNRMRQHLGAPTPNALFGSSVTSQVADTSANLPLPPLLPEHPPAETPSWRSMLH